MIGRWTTSGAVALAVLAVGCTGEIMSPSGTDDGPGDRADRPLPPEDPTRPGLVRECDDTFAAVPPQVYAAKVKSLLTAMPLTTDELATLQANGDAFPALVEGWVDSAGADEKLLRFFATAFQQDGFEDQGLADLLGIPVLGRFPDGTRVETLLVQSFRESFSRLALEIFREGRSFDEVLTTREGYFTPAQLLAMAHRDDYLHDDEDQQRYRVARDRIPRLVYQSHTPTPLAQSLDPNSPSFMAFYVEPENVDVSGCQDGEHVRTEGSLPRLAFRAINGFFVGNGGSCEFGNQRGEPLLETSDYTAYRRVRIREPEPGEATTKFWDLDTLRNGDEMVFSIPRVGFFTSPGFFATWPTNDSNQARVTVNQTLIVALGESFDGENSVVPAFDDALDGEHADPSTACYGCHVNLDPMRQYFRNSYSFFYHEQTDDTVREARAAFGFHGVSAEGEDVFDLAEILAGHPRFAPAMVQKACYFTTSAACPEDVPEFEAVLESFIASGLDYRRMLIDLLSSPLVTGAACVPGGGGDLASAARQRHLCASLSKRLGYPNACGVDVGFDGDLDGTQRYLRQLVEVVPDDAYSRGAEEPVLITDTNMFLGGAADAICGRLSREVTGEGKRLTADDPDGAIEILVTELMGLVVGDPRREPARAILRSHFDAAEEASNARAALESTFVTACVSPGVTAMGL